MKKILLLLLLSFSTTLLIAHDIHYEKVVLRKWDIEKEKRQIEASLMLIRNKTAVLEDAHGKIITIPIASLSAADQQFVKEKHRHVHDLNSAITKEATPQSGNRTENIIRWGGMLLLLSGILIFLYRNFKKSRHKYVLPILSATAGLTLFGFSSDIIKSMQTAPETLDSAFAPFRPNINTYWDNTYFYVESKGIPVTHQMMVGISNHGWQQQVPIPQCYTGSNAWPIPLNPVMATNPIPVDSIHFTRGAIAIAANGVPIFNVHTNTGVDSYLDGQLDNYGGHCGRADDYHYHIAPLHLYSFTTQNLPIAYGLDGYPVFGSVEPDGSAMQSLDANHGHNYNGKYHYHGTPAAPYMIARMAGQVTEDATHQLIPQAAAHPVRPSLTPLNGALITACTSNGTGNGYQLDYTRNSNQHSVQYSWNTTGQYSFSYFTNGNLDSNRNFNGFVQCNVPTGIQQPSEIVTLNGFSIFPNPNNGTFRVQLNRPSEEKDVKTMSIYNLQGQKVWESHQFQRNIENQELPGGVYLLKIQLNSHILTSKFILH
jgi:hypothetical protein